MKGLLASMGCLLLMFILSSGCSVTRDGGTVTMGVTIGTPFSIQFTRTVEPREGEVTDQIDCPALIEYILGDGNDDQGVPETGEPATEEPG